jgi:hypothetical protein
MSVEIVTREDLNQFRSELITEIRQLLTATQKPIKEWLKAVEVRKMLSISPNTLIQMRNSGQLNFSKIGGLYYYSMTDIERLMQSTRKQN